MSLSERIDQLEPRERQLLTVMGVVFAAMLVAVGPILLWTRLSDDRAQNLKLRDSMAMIRQNEAKVATRNAGKDAVDARYDNTAPALAGFLDKLAKKNGLEIPESQDRATVPHGKRYEERSTKISLRKVGMFPLSKFMEGIERSGHPVKISKLNVRKRSGAPDSYDVSMTVSAFDSKEPESKKTSDSADDEEAL